MFVALIGSLHLDSGAAGTEHDSSGNLSAVESQKLMDTRDDAGAFCFRYIPVAGNCLA